MWLLCNMSVVVFNVIFVRIVVSLSSPHQNPSYMFVHSMSNTLPGPDFNDNSFFYMALRQAEGFDMRYDNNTSNNPPPESIVTIEHLASSQKKQALLAILEDPYVSLHRKTILVEEEDILSINKLVPDICAGGLMDDWDFSAIN